MSELLFVERRGPVVVLTLNRPDALNALTPALIARLEEELSLLGRDRSCRAVVLTGAGKAFCAGVEVGNEEYDPLKARVFLKDLNRVFDDLEGLPQPTVAALNGPAVAGGLELALACTFRFAAESVRLGLPEIKLGLVAAVGTTYRLPRLVGFGRAAEMCLLGDLVDAETARAWGLVNRVYRSEELSAAAEGVATRLAEGPPVALSLMKDALYANAGGAAQGAALLEVLSASVNHFTTDKREGMAAFFEKRPPVFKGE
jgi:enoyl-CoA hydratase/carnithine racemase